MGRFFVYMVTCSDGSLYTGYTTAPKRRLARHNAGTGARYTRSRRPVRLAYLQEFRTRSEALRREAALKRLGRDSKLRLCLEYENENTKRESLGKKAQGR